MSESGKAGAKTAVSMTPRARVIETDKEWLTNVADVDYHNYIFERVSAKGIAFRDIDFRYCTFDSCYLRLCTFESCDFTGAKFSGSNLHGSRFSGCNFDYTMFERTQVENDILESCAPQRENLRQRFARTLRTNYQSLGDSDSVNKAILVELAATRIHLRNAWDSADDYYRSKYAGLERVKSFFSWLKFVGGDLLWGNGERAVRLVRASISVVILLAVGDTVVGRHPLLVGDWASALADAVQAFLGTNQPTYPWPVVALVALTRYILLGLFVSVLIRRFARR